jgi:hypothetical protein
MNHLPYDAFNGSLVEQELFYVVGNEEPPCEAIKHMAIGDIRPREDESLMLWFLKLLMNKLPLMYLIVRGSRPLLESIRVAVPHLGATVLYPL